MNGDLVQTAGPAPGTVQTPPPEPTVGQTFNVVQAAVAANVGIISYWLIELALARLSVKPPDNVVAAFQQLGATAVACVCAYVGAKLRTAQWTSQLQITGLKKLFILPLLLFPLSGCAGVKLPIPTHASGQQALGVAWQLYTAFRDGAEIACGLVPMSTTPECQAAMASIALINALAGQVQEGTATPEAVVAAVQTELPTIEKAVK